MLELSTKQFFPVEFETVCIESDNEKRIVLASNSLEFINETLELIADYTKKIDPNAPLDFFEVNKIVDSQGAGVSTKNSFKYNIDIQGILPRTVRIFYGFYESIYANCHGSALMTSGAFPVIRMLDCSTHSPIYSPWLKDIFEEIPLKNIDKGDLVFLDSKDNHSFVFLSHNVCLSMNGRGKPLKLYPTNEVLRLYGYSEDALKSSEQSNIKIYRKKECGNYFEPVMPEILEYWGFYNNLMLPGSIPETNPNFSRVAPIHQKLREFKLRVKANPLLTQTHKDAVKVLYRNFCQTAAIDFKAERNESRKLAEVVKVEPIAYSSYLSIQVILPVAAVLLGALWEISYNSQSFAHS